MPNIVHNIGVAAQIGSYSDAIEVPPGARWLFTSGTPGLALDGELPADISGQAELAWEHVVNTLKSADMTVHDLVKVTHYLLHERDIPDYVKVRSRFLGDAATGIDAAHRRRPGEERVSARDRGGGGKGLIDPDVITLEPQFAAAVHDLVSQLHRGAGHGHKALRTMRSNRLEALSGDRQGQYAISINRQWRICFEWPDGQPGPSQVEIVDYHS